MSATPQPQDHRTARRRHPASRARVAAALLAMGGFLGTACGMAAAGSTRGAGTGATTSSGSTTSMAATSSSTTATASPAAASTGTKVVTTTHGS